MGSKSHPAFERADSPRVAVFGLLVVIAAAGIAILAVSGDISALSDTALPAAMENFGTSGASGTMGP